MVRRDEVPPFMDLGRWWVKLGIGLGVGIPAAALMVLAYGISLGSIGIAAGTAGCCVGVVYLIDHLGQMIP